MSTKKTAVVLFQLGGPDSLDAVEPFLYNLFCDPDIIDLPGAFLFRKTLARLISSRRAPKVRGAVQENRRRHLPFFRKRLRQAKGLARVAQEKGISADVHVAMRYWHPMTEEVHEQIRKDRVEEVVLLPLYPQYSKVTTGSSVKAWRRCVHKMKIGSYFNESWSKVITITQCMLRRSSRISQRSIDKVPQDERRTVHLVFSAHGTPMKLVKEGDPYSKHIQKTYEAVIAAGNFGLAHHLCFQSKIGPAEVA